MPKRPAPLDDSSEEQRSGDENPKRGGVVSKKTSQQRKVISKKKRDPSQPKRMPVTFSSMPNMEQLCPGYGMRADKMLGASGSQKRTSKRQRITAGEASTEVSSSPLSGASSGSCTRKAESSSEPSQRKSVRKSSRSLASTSSSATNRGVSSRRPRPYPRVSDGLQGRVHTGRAQTTENASQFLHLSPDTSRGASDPSTAITQRHLQVHAPAARSYVQSPLHTFHSIQETFNSAIHSSLNSSPHHSSSYQAQAAPAFDNNLEGFGSLSSDVGHFSGLYYPQNEVLATPGYEAQPIVIGGRPELPPPFPIPTLPHHGPTTANQNILDHPNFSIEAIGNAPTISITQAPTLLGSYGTHTLDLYRPASGAYAGSITSGAALPSPLEAIVGRGYSPDYPSRVTYDPTPGVDILPSTPTPNNRSTPHASLDASPRFLSSYYQGSQPPPSTGSTHTASSSADSSYMYWHTPSPIPVLPYKPEEQGLGQLSTMDLTNIHDWSILYQSDPGVAIYDDFSQSHNIS